jgi:hypothetical protein
MTLPVMTKLANGFLNNSLTAAQNRVEGAAREIGQSFSKAALHFPLPAERPGDALPRRFPREFGDTVPWDLSE